MGPAKWLQRALKQRRHCHSLFPTQLDSFPRFNMTKTQLIFPNSGCHSGPCATLNRVSLRALACLFNWQRLVTWISTHPLCSPFSISHTNMCPISAFPRAWNIHHIHERNIFQGKLPSLGTSKGNLSFFDTGLQLFVLFCFVLFEETDQPKVGLLKINRIKFKWANDHMPGQCLHCKVWFCTWVFFNPHMNPLSNFCCFLNHK